MFLHTLGVSESRDSLKVLLPAVSHDIFEVNVCIFVQDVYILTNVFSFSMKAIVAWTYWAFVTPWPRFWSLCATLSVSAASSPATCVYLSCASSCHSLQCQRLWRYSWSSKNIGTPTRWLLWQITKAVHSTSSCSKCCALRVCVTKTKSQEHSRWRTVVQPKALERGA